MIVPNLPNQTYFYIGEVSEFLNIKPHIIRYWEQEFPFLNPKKTKTGHRLYKKKDIELLARIHELIYIEKYTIDGVIRKISQEKKHSTSLFEPDFYYSKLQNIKKELETLLDFINKNLLK